LPLLLLGLAALAGCDSSAPDPDDPGAVALRLFRLAGDEPPAPELESLFEPDALKRSPVSLLDALAALPAGAEARVRGVEQATGGRQAWADLSVELPGGGRADYTVQLRATEGRGWRIAWFQGPGVEWPVSDPGGAGLSTSAPPDP
jgi:hypothetical protein